MTYTSCECLKTLRNWAIAASQHRSGRLRPEPATRSQPFGCSSHIAGARLEILCILACLAIWGGTFLAIGRL